MSDVFDAWDSLIGHGMTNEYEFTLHSPLTKEDWNKLSDAEHENTMSVTFQTPQGRQVRYIKCEVLDKIRSEIEQSFDGYLVVDKDKDYASNTFKGQPAITINHVFEIIDKYTKAVEE